MIRIKFFARLKESLNCDQIEVQTDSSVTVSELLKGLINARPEWKEPLTSIDLMTAINQSMCTLTDQVNPGDEVAFFPPVTGG